MNAPDPLTLPRLPRDAEGPVFAEPWQAQAFALALQLHAQGCFAWTEWAEALARRLKAAGPEDDGARYYEHWLATLEDLVKAKRLAADPELDARKDAWAEAYRRTAHGRPVELQGTFTAVHALSPERGLENMVQYAVALKDGDWTVFSDGQPIERGLSRSAAIQTAKDLAFAAEARGDAVELLIQGYYGDLARKLSGGSPERD